MRHLFLHKDTPVEMRADEFDYLPFENTEGVVWHTLVTDEDCHHKDQRLIMRRQKRLQKARDKNER